MLLNVCIVRLLRLCLRISKAGRCMLRGWYHRRMRCGVLGSWPAGAPGLLAPDASQMC